jgi:hypothetical protein
MDIKSLEVRGTLQSYQKIGDICSYYKVGFVYCYSMIKNTWFDFTFVNEQVQWC